MWRVGRHKLRGGWSLGDHAPYPTSRLWHRRPFNRSAAHANYQQHAQINSVTWKRWAAFGLREHFHCVSRYRKLRRRIYATEVKNLVTIVNFSSLTQSIHCFTAGAQSSVNNQSNETIKYRSLARQQWTCLGLMALITGNDCLRTFHFKLRLFDRVVSE